MGVTVTPISVGTGQSVVRHHQGAGRVGWVAHPRFYVHERQERRPMGSPGGMPRFGTVVTCIDGRVQEPVARWLKQTYQLDYVDVITEPGPDRFLSENGGGRVRAIRDMVDISLNAHHSNLLAIAGHHDCAANPVSTNEHLEQIRKAVQVIRFWNLPVTVVGLWVNDAWRVETVAG